MSLPHIEVRYDGVLHSPYTGGVIFSADPLDEPNEKDPSVIFIHCEEWSFVHPVVLKILDATDMYDLEVEDVIEQLDIPTGFAISLIQPISDITSICGFAEPTEVERLRSLVGVAGRPRMRSVK